jgi:transposase-like protein
MQRFALLEELLKSRHFDKEIVVLCVRWNLSFILSYRDLVAMMGKLWTQTFNSVETAARVVC